LITKNTRGSFSLIRSNPHPATINKESKPGMKKNQTYTTAAVSVLSLMLGASQLLAQSNIGQWDFIHSNLVQTAGATLGDLQYADGPTGATATQTAFNWTTNFGIPNIAGVPAQVMKVPAGAIPMGYLMPTPPANGGGSLVNEYTYIIDAYYPSGGQFRPLVQMDDGNLDHILAYLAVGANDALEATNTSGVQLPSGNGGQVPAGAWYRLGFVVSMSAGEIDFYTNGVRVGVLKGVGKLDSPYTLLAASTLYLLSSPQTNVGCYISSVQLRDTPLSRGQLRALGAVSASKIPITIPPVSTFIVSQSPDQGEITGPLPVIHVVLDQGDSTLNVGSVQLSLDGSVVPATVAAGNPNQFTVDYSVTNLYDPGTPHTLQLTFQDNIGGVQSSTWSFTVATYQNVTLPAPIYLETFDEVAEGGIPTGWVVTNWTDTLTPGLNLLDTQSDSYKDWVTISAADYASVYGDTQTYTSPGFPPVSGNRRQMIPPIVLNGVLLDSLVSNNLITAESDQRDGSQVQVMFTKDYDLTGQTNVYLSFHNLNEQNQDNICSVEYSIDQGATWLPLLYMLDDGTTDGDGSDVITNSATGQIDVFATFGRARSDQAHGLAYSNFIGAAVSTNLIPAIRPCRNDDPVQQKRIEVFRLPLADNQSHVRFRLGQAGTASWFFAVDDFGLYSITLPVITTQPQSLTVDANTAANFSVVAAGGSLGYQWRFNGLNIAGATNSAYLIAAAFPTNAGFYSVVVSNASGKITSSPAQLTVNTNPALQSNPVGEIADPGATVTFSVNATGGRPITFKWLFNGTQISSSTAAPLTLANVQSNNIGNYQVVAMNTYGAVTSGVAALKVYSGPLTNSLVVHLTFDGNLNDTSGRTNNATYQFNGAAANPNATFRPGKLGSAFQVTTLIDSSAYEYATLGYPTDLQFGETSDFSVSFWASYTNQSDDIPFISNKDWDASANPGWGIFTQGGGNYRINVTGPNSDADKYSQTDTPQVLKDGNWHHIAVSIQHAPFGQSAFIYGYQDGVLVSKHPMNVAGTVDTAALPLTDHQTKAPVPTLIQSQFQVNIGQDGTGIYTDNHSGRLVGLLDDFGIWRRAITANEVAGIYKGGNLGKDLSQTTTPTFLVARKVGSNIVITWTPDPVLKLQTTTLLRPTSWSDVPGTLGAGSATLPLSGTSAFFRLSQ
jgi:hypothetical protein